MKIKLITSGLNYFGYRDKEFSSIGWETAGNDVVNLLKTADSQAENINNILKTVLIRDVMSSNQQLLTDAMLVPARAELKETDRRIRLEESLKEKAVKVRNEKESFQIRTCDTKTASCWSCEK